MENYKFQIFYADDDNVNNNNNEISVFKELNFIQNYFLSI